jgi:inhibitor of cysteine peptidase
MRTKLSIITLIFTALIAASIGCQSDTGEQYTEIKLAPIHDAHISVNMSLPEQIFVDIKGGLADSCTTFHDLETERIGNIINITVTTERPKNAICAQVYSYFKKNVALGSDFISGDTYTVNVNDVTISFEYP